MLYLVKLYALFIGLGLGPSIWLSSWYKQKTQLAVALAPAVGYAIINIISVYFLAFHLTAITNWLEYANYVTLSLSLVLFLAYLYTHRQKLTITFKAVPYFYILFAIVLWLALNNYHDGILKHYINPDISSYLAASTWIAHGNGIINIRPDYQGGITEILDRALRWGLPAFTAMVKNSLNSEPYESLFSITFILFASSTWVSAILFNNFINTSNQKLSQVIAITILANGSLLYFLTESFLPYIIGVSGLMMLSAFVVSAKNENPGWQVIATVALISCLIMATCSELFCLSLAAIIGVIIIDYIKQKEIKATFIILLAAMIGFLIVIPLSYQLVYFSFKNFNNANNIGYLQPTWLWPSDIVSLTNIYSQSKAYLDNAIAVRSITRHGLALFSSSILSLWVLYELFTKSIKHSLLLVSLIGWLAFLGLNRYMIHHGYPPHNYFYDKLISVFSPIFIAYFYNALTQDKEFKAKLKIYFALTLAIISSLLFIHDRSRFHATIDTAAINEINRVFKGQDVVFFSNKRGLREGKMHGKLRYIDRANDIITSTLLSDKLLDQWDNGIWSAYPQNSKIILLLNAESLPKSSSIIKHPSMQFGPYILIDTHITIADLGKKHWHDNLEKLYTKFIK